jgi:hypothetical protein
MTELETLEQLLVLTRIKYDRQQQDFAKILAEEASIRQKLDQLVALNQAAEPGDMDHIGMQAIGADILWQGWLGRAKTSLNMQFSRVLARKAHEQTKIRRAHGKVVAIETLIHTMKESQRKTRKARQLDATLEADICARFSLDQ